MHFFLWFCRMFGVKMNRSTFFVRFCRGFRLATLLYDTLSKKINEVDIYTLLFSHILSQRHWLPQHLRHNSCCMYIVGECLFKFSLVMWVARQTLSLYRIEYRDGRYPNLGVTILLEVVILCRISVFIFLSGCSISVQSMSL